MRINIAICFLLLGFTACTAHKKLIKTAQPVVNVVTTEKEKPVVVSNNVVNDIEQFASTYLLKDSNLLSAHVGISVYDPAEKKYLYNYQGDKYFIPASNTKLLMCYAAMKYLGDSLVGMRYDVDNNTGSIAIQGNADPTFLHPDFKYQPVYDFLQNSKNGFALFPSKFLEKGLGFGWAWDDYNSDYMAERSEFPIYGNVIRIKAAKNSDEVIPSIRTTEFAAKEYLDGSDGDGKYSYKRALNDNILNLILSQTKFKSQEIPFITSNKLMISFLKDTIKGINIGVALHTFDKLPKIIHSQPTDSLLKITMHRSDNFFAEQTLLMVSNERLGLMSDAKIIDTLLKTDYKEFPQKPKWVDGSGLSRYNLISPQDFVFLLEKMKNEFAWNRITTILPTGDEGTLKGLYKNYVGKIYAKTGTVSNNLALSGYIITNKNKTFIFSVMVNNHQASASAIRRSFEKFLTEIIEKY